MEPKLYIYAYLKWYDLSTAEDILDLKPKTFREVVERTMVINI